MPNDEFNRPPDSGPDNPNGNESYFETEGHFNSVEIRWLREIILSFTE